MSFNILDTMKDHLTDQVMARIGDVIGSDAGQTTNALSGALPGLFSSFSEIGSKELGAEALFAAVDDQDDSILGSLGDFLASDNASKVANSGASLLGSVLGNDNLGSLVAAVSKLSGLGSGSSSSLLGMLAPIALGVIKRKLLGDGGFDVGSMMKLLTGQKQNIQAALPHGFMQNTGGKIETENVEPITVTDKVSSSYTATEEDETSLFANLIPWLMLLLGLLILYFLFLGKSGDEEVIEEQTSQTETIDRSAPKTPEQTQPAVNEKTVAAEPSQEASKPVEEAAEPAQENTPATKAPSTKTETETPETSKPSDASPTTEAASPEASSINVTNELRNNLSSITQSLSGIKDIESAKASLPAIDAANTRIAKMTGMLDAVPAPAKGAIANLISSALPQLQVLSDKANAIPGVGDVINPALNVLAENLKKFQ